MSEVYVHEPLTKGKVTLHTSHGSIDIELWSKECPKAARNFVQLCLEGYYDGTIFHRIIPEFIVQGGDPTGTGDGGESIYAAPFPDEYHSRLKYRYRGLVGMASKGTGTNSNGSQFFITLARADPLNNRHTLFGKVTGHTIYNLMNLAAVECDADDRPRDPPVLRSCEVLWNPFEDIVPRCLPSKIVAEAAEDEDTKPVHRPALQQLRTNLLSFEEDEEEDDEGVDEKEEDQQFPKQGKKRLMKSAHDVLDDDPRLCREVGVVDEEEGERVRKKLRELSSEQSSGEIRDAGSAGRSEESPQKHNSDSGISEKDVSPTESTGPSQPRNVQELKLQRKRALAEEEKNIRKEIHALKLRAPQSKGSDGDALPDAELLTEREKQRQVALNRNKDSNKRQKQKAVIEKLLSFRSRVRLQQEESNPVRVEPKEQLGIQLSEYTAVPDLDEHIDESDGSWLKKGGLKFAVDSSKAFQMDAAKDNLAIFDPLSAASGATEVLPAGKAASIMAEAERRRRNQRMTPSLKGQKADWR